MSDHVEDAPALTGDDAPGLDSEGPHDAIAGSADFQAVMCMGNIFLDTTSAPNSAKKREKTFLDDLLAVFNHVVQSQKSWLFRKCYEKPLLQIRSIVFSLGLEFCFEGTVQVSGKPFKCWSALRVALRDLIVGCLSKIKAISDTLPTNGEPNASAAATIATAVSKVAAANGVTSAAVCAQGHMDSTNQCIEELLSAVSTHGPGEPEGRRSAVNMKVKIASSNEERPAKKPKLIVPPGADQPIRLTMKNIFANANAAVEPGASAVPASAPGRTKEVGDQAALVARSQLVEEKPAENPVVNADAAAISTFPQAPPSMEEAPPAALAAPAATQEEILGGAQAAEIATDPATALHLQPLPLWSSGPSQAALFRNGQTLLKTGAIDLRVPDELLKVPASPTAPPKPPQTCLILPEMFEGDVARWTLPAGRYRTMFSGVDSPGVALYSMTAMVKDYLNIPSMEGPSHESAVEWNVSCQDELQLGPCKPKQLFRDIKGFFKPEALATIQSVRERGLPLNRRTVMPMLHSGKATKRTSFCVLHQKECVVEPCREAYAGFPCVSWSPQGSRQRDDSEDFDCWCAMAALVLDVEDDCVIVECSHMYDTSILAEAWNPKYASFFVVIDAMNFGTASRRQRMWGACVSRSTITQSWSSLQNVIPMFYRCVAASFDFSHYLIATRDELDAELKWAMTRPKSLASGKSLDELKRSPRPFWEALTAKEQEFELKYAKVHQPSVARSLNQNP
ncbi:unnamed protein product, partial [Effrenium voratum]